MTSFTIYKLSTADQLDLFYSNGDKLEFNFVLLEMKRKPTPIGEKGEVIGEGFVNPTVTKRNGIDVLEAFGTTLINLGNYIEMKIDNDEVSSREAQYNYYSKAKIMLTQDSYLALKFENSTEEKTKSKVKALVEDLGFEAMTFKIDNNLLRKIQDEPGIKWSAAKRDRITKDGDKTTKVSYEIDLADDTNSSAVDENYKEHGELSHLKFQMPYTGENGKVTVSLYNNGHRIYFEEEELETSAPDDFVVFLMGRLIEISEKDIVSNEEATETEGVGSQGAEEVAADIYGVNDSEKD